MTRTRSPFVPTPALEAIMERQRGIFTADQAYAAGYTVTEIQHFRDAKALMSVRRGVYAVKGTYDVLAAEQRHLVDAQALLLKLGSAVTLSHETAAVWSGLPLLRPELGMLHVTRPELPASRREAGVHHHPGSLPDAHVVKDGGVRLTNDPRTAIDVARTNDFARGLVAVDSSMRRGTEAAELLSVMEHCRCWPGARDASRAVSAGDGRSANPGESWSRARLIELGLAPDDLQVPIAHSEGVDYADFGWLDRGVLGEFDGRQKYAVPSGADAEEAARVVWREKRREDRLRDLGWEVVRWVWADLFQPAQIEQRVLAAFARAAVRRRTVGWCASTLSPATDGATGR